MGIYDIFFFYCHNLCQKGNNNWTKAVLIILLIILYLKWDKERLSWRKGE